MVLPAPQEVTTQQTTTITQMNSKSKDTMKTNYLTLSAALMIAATMVSCSKMETISPAADVKENDTISIDFTCQSADTKTEYNGDKIFWSAGDTIKFYQAYYTTADATKLSLQGANGKVSKAAEKYSVTINFNEPAKFPAQYFAICPAFALTSYTAQDGNIEQVVCKLNSTQTPAKDNFDPKADLLLSEKLVAETEKITSFSLGFQRLVALARMQLTNIPSESNVAKVTFSAAQNGSDIHLAGQRYFNLADGSADSYKTYANGIAMKCSDLALSQNMTAHFCCYPFELGAGDSFTVRVNTEDGRYYTRTVTLPEGRDLILEQGHATNFTVNMAESFFRATATPKTTSATASAVTLSFYGNKVSKVQRAFFTAESLAALSEDEYETKAFAKPSSYSSTLYTALTDTQVEKLNTNGSIGVSYTTIASGVTLEPGKDYVVMVKGFSTTGATKFMYFKVTTPAYE